MTFQRGQLYLDSTLGAPVDGSAICQDRGYRRGEKLTSSILETLPLGPPRDCQLWHAVDRQAVFLERGQRCAYRYRLGNDRFR